MVDERHPAEHDNRERARIVAALVLLALLIAFVLKNTTEVNVSFVFFDHRTRLIYVFIVTTVLGVVLDRLWQHHRQH
jgi:uncharacterized integral membrane protein